MASQSFASPANNLNAVHSHSYPASLVDLLTNFAHHISTHHFYPRFDIEEHEHTYELYGDLPGAQQASLNIATIDEHSLEISGTTATQSVSAAGNGTSERNINTTQHETALPASQSTVEAEQLVVNCANGKPPPPANNNSDGGVLTKTHQHEETKSVPEMKVKYLMKERQNGEFHRVFPFANPIKENEVTASFHNGIVHVTVPKGPAPVKNRINIYYQGMVF